MVFFNLEILKAIILGIIEGITEFIPVSSTGHLILAGDIIGFTGENAKTFEIFIQLGAILSVVWLYRERLLSSIKGIGTERENRFFINIFVAFLPAVFFGLFFHSFIKDHLFNPVTVAIALISGGFAILIIEKAVKNPVVMDVDDISIKRAVGIGLAQILSFLPGVSRAGATIMGAMCLGLERKTATEFSFFLAIPTMFAAVSYDLIKNINSLSFSDIHVFSAGFIVSFLSAMLVIKAFLRFVKNHTFNSFAIYRIFFGSIILFYYL